MMTESELQLLKDRKNRETVGAWRRQFQKKGTDQQHHANLLSHTEVLIEVLRADIAAGMVISTNLRAAMRELEPAILLSKRRLES